MPYRIAEPSLAVLKSLREAYFTAECAISALGNVTVINAADPCINQEIFRSAQELIRSCNQLMTVGCQELGVVPTLCKVPGPALTRHSGLFNGTPAVDWARSIGIRVRLRRVLGTIRRLLNLHTPQGAKEVLAGLPNPRLR